MSSQQDLIRAYPVYLFRPAGGAGAGESPGKDQLPHPAPTTICPFSALRLDGEGAGRRLRLLRRLPVADDVQGMVLRHCVPTSRPKTQDHETMDSGRRWQALSAAARVGSVQARYSGYVCTSVLQIISSK